MSFRVGRKESPHLSASEGGEKFDGRVGEDVSSQGANLCPNYAWRDVTGRFRMSRTQRL